MFVVVKVWDIGGQPRFRSMWERYCRGVNAIVYVCYYDNINLQLILTIGNIMEIGIYVFSNARMIFEPVAFSVSLVSSVLANV